MSNFIIELALIHIAFIAGYWLLLRKEKQYGTMRFYLIAATLLSILIPLFELPDPFYTPVESSQVTITQTLGAEAFELLPTEETIDWGLVIAVSVYTVISLLFLFSLIKSVMHIVRIKDESSPHYMSGNYIRKVSNLKGSFSFFNWIFLSDEIINNPEDYKIILKHEKAHAHLGHTYDLLFFELFKVCFWWLPTAWYAIKEIKTIHEYQADTHAMEACGIEQYSSILISSTLKTNGWSLASSFHDSLILKRLKAMKEQKKKVSPWKLSILSMLLATLFVAFACTEEVDLAEAENSLPISGQNTEVFTVVESTPQFTGGMDAFYSHIQKAIRYPKQARIDGIEGKVWVQFVIERDGSVSNVKVLKGIGSLVDEEAVRVLESLPDFKPATQRGKTVRVKKVIPIQFKLDPEKKNPDNTPQGIITFEEVQDIEFKLKIEASYVEGAWIGTVYDEETGNVMPGANIVVAGTTQGTVSDLDGTFRLTTGKEAEVAISFVGYKSVKLKAVE